MTNKGVFITGAASGIGLATALKFAGEGWRVAAATSTARPCDEILEVTAEWRLC